MSKTVRPFQACVSELDLQTLKQRLDATRWPDRETCDGWNQGTPLDYAQELADYWRTDYDWRRAEATLNQWPQSMVTLECEGETYDIHCIHRPSNNPQAMPLLITHGWPGSIFEFYKVIDALADPCTHGGDAADAFHVIIPSLPGYGFSSKPKNAGTSIERIADLWDSLMLTLGYERYFAQGGDWGSMVTRALGMRHAQRCAGIHLNMIVAPPSPAALGDLSAAEEQILGQLDYYTNWDSTYAKQQATRPQSLGYALADSAVGQMGWIVEKFWAWTDCEIDGHRHPENAVTRDEILDNVSLYWLTNSATSSARLYWESYNHLDLTPVDVPMGGSRFSADIFPTSERWARPFFPKMVYWNEFDRGGHFAALEQPEVFVQELRACFRLMR